MLQAYLSIGYIVLLAILVLAFILWRRGAPILAIAALVVGIPLWFGWEYVRPTWTTGIITGTEVRRSDPNARGNTTDIEYIYTASPSSSGSVISTPSSGCADRVRRCVIATPIVGSLLKEEGGARSPLLFSSWFEAKSPPQRCSRRKEMTNEKSADCDCRYGSASTTSNVDGKCIHDLYHLAFQE